MNFRTQKMLSTRAYDETRLIWWICKVFIIIHTLNSFSVSVFWKVEYEHINNFFNCSNESINKLSVLAWSWNIISVTFKACSSCRGKENYFIIRSNTRSGIHTSCFLSFLSRTLGCCLQEILLKIFSHYMEFFIS